MKPIRQAQANGNRSLAEFRNREELIETLGFCKPAKEEAKFRQEDCCEGSQFASVLTESVFRFQENLINPLGTNSREGLRP